MARIAVIHSEEHVQLLYEVELKEAGYEVVIHPDGRNGIVEFVGEEKPKLVIIGEGTFGNEIFPREIILEIKEKFPLIKVIFATCYDTFSQKDMECADSVIVMSFDFTELKQKMVRLLET